MKDNLGGAIWRLTIFLAVCSAGCLRTVRDLLPAAIRRDRQSYRARVHQLPGHGARRFRPHRRCRGRQGRRYARSAMTAPSLVEFTADESVVLTEGTRAVIRYDDLIGGRYLGLQEGTGDTRSRLQAGATIPLSRTAPALDLDALIGGFRPLFKALEPRSDQRVVGPVDQRAAGTGRHHRVLPHPDRGADQHAGRP